MNRAVAVTGIGVSSSLGSTITDFTKSLMEGKSGIVPLDDTWRNEFGLYPGSPDRQMTDYLAPVGTTKQLNDTLYAMGLDRKIVRKMSRTQKMSYSATIEARQNSQLDTKNPYTAEKTAAYLGSGMGGYTEIAQAIVSGFQREEKTKQSAKYSPFFMPKGLITTQAEQVFQTLGCIGGGLTTHAEACAAASSALASARTSIAYGRRDLAIVMGVESAISPSGTGGFNTIGALTTNGGGSRPFDSERDGFVEGEGSGAMILEDYETAVKRGATIYAVLRGYGKSSDLHHAIEPNSTGQTCACALEDMLISTETNKSDVTFIQTHGTSTPLGDAAEIKGISQVFGRKTPYLTALKSQMGHTKGASGMFGSIAAVLNLSHQRMNPIINTSSIDTQICQDIDIDRFILFEEDTVLFGERYRDIAIKNVVVNAFAFGRTGVSLLFGKN